MVTIKTDVLVSDLLSEHPALLCPPAPVSVESSQPTSVVEPLPWNTCRHTLLGKGTEAESGVALVPCHLCLEKLKKQHALQGGRTRIPQPDVTPEWKSDAAASTPQLCLDLAAQAQSSYVTLRMAQQRREVERLDLMDRQSTPTYPAYSQADPSWRREYLPIVSRSSSRRGMSRPTQSGFTTHALKDYQNQLILLDQQKRKREDLEHEKNQPQDYQVQLQILEQANQERLKIARAHQLDTLNQIRRMRTKGARENDDTSSMACNASESVTGAGSDLDPHDLCADSVWTPVDDAPVEGLIQSTPPPTHNFTHSWATGPLIISGMQRLTDTPPAFTYPLLQPPAVQKVHQHPALVIRERPPVAK